MLGNFSNFWDEDQKEAVQLEFHLASRDVVQACLGSDFQAAKSLYSEHFIKLDKAESLIEKGIEKIVVSTV